MECEKCYKDTFCIHLTSDHAKLCPECYEGDMSLNEKQFKFTFYTSRLIKYAYDMGYTLSYGESYDDDGVGHIKGSYHYIRLAVDFNLFKDGVFLTDTEDHRFLGEFWEYLDPMCTWGGRWSDGNHYSYGEGK